MDVHGLIPIILLGWMMVTGIILLGYGITPVTELMELDLLKCILMESIGQGFPVIRQTMNLPQMLPLELVRYLIWRQLVHLWVAWIMLEFGRQQEQLLKFQLTRIVFLLDLKPVY